MYVDEQLRMFIDECECLFLHFDESIDMWHNCVFSLGWLLKTRPPKGIHSPLPWNTREKDILFLWALLKRQNCRSPIDVGDIATKAKLLFDSGNSALEDRSITRGELAGSRITMGPPESPYNVTSVFFNIASTHLLPKELKFEHGGAKLVSCPGRHLTQLLPRTWTS